ncbi:MAG: YceI family protein, partial [Bacteroidetes bacterium]|nr:YceI family protein [Bacteroidota bacterium]
MKKIITAALIFASFSTFAQKFTTSTGKIDIVSTSPATDVEAKSKKVIAAIDVQTRQFAFKIDMTTLDFPNDEMENHYNEKYLETDKKENRYSTFSGKILGTQDLTKDGTYKVVAQGKFNCHNVTVERNIVATIKVVGGKITVESEFFVNLKEYKIDVPSMAFAKVGENIKVNLV